MCARVLAGGAWTDAWADDPLAVLPALDEEGEGGGGHLNSAHGTEGAYRDSLKLDLATVLRAAAVARGARAQVQYPSVGGAYRIMA